ncbi:MAG: PatB family C-S lyase [Deltaproteobacteria bacterium]|jgi:cystathionine beta-lyase|nr:PatB family C-S lyase [Deltaproteobacteria bacterium]
MKNDYSFDFDPLVNRRGTDSAKWAKYQGTDIIPLWVADMDFKSPPAILQAVHERIEHGVFGYTLPSAELNDVVISRLDDHYGWKIEPKWLVWLPGLVTGFNVACRAIGEAGDDVMTAIPVYHPFLSAPANFNRRLIRVPLMEINRCWYFDFDRIEEAITPQTRLFLLCSPHNPVGRVFSAEELTTLARICEKHDIIICSDEIHCDLILDPEKSHIPTASLNPSIADRTITLMSASKTFNIPGLGCAFAVISNRALRKRYIRAMAGIVPHINTLGYVATLSAFRDCADWHAALLDYLRKNRDLVTDAIADMPNLTMAPLEATYLAWIDVRKTGLENPIEYFESAGIGMQDGADFDGPGFVRFNFGCPQETLKEALRRMATALDKLKAQ